MHINHVQCSDGCLLLYFGKLKTNQHGKKCKKPWHVYSNPENMHLCPVLALEKYLLSHPDLLKGKWNLFPGSNQYMWFTHIFHKVIKYHIEEVRVIGVEEGYIGGHPCRKGELVLVLSGCTVSPRMSYICLRVYFSMGQVKYRYIHYEKVGDQFVFLIGTGISSLMKEFWIYPCYYDYTCTSIGPKQKIDATIKKNLVKR